MAQCTTIRNGRRRHKVPYRNKRRARTALRQAAKRFGFSEDELEVYRCTVCGEYHYGRVQKEEQHAPA